MQNEIMQKEVEDIQASIYGLAENGVDLCKPGRRFILKDELTRQKKKGGLVKYPYCMFLFNDIIVLTERYNKKAFSLKYVTSMFIKDILLIDCADSKDKYAFGILHKGEKKKMKFSVKTHLQKVTWKTKIEQQIEKYCPTDSGDGELSSCGSPRNSWNSSSMGELLGYNNSLGSHCELESDADERSSCGETPPQYPLLNGASPQNDWSTSEDNDSNSYTEDTDEGRSDEESECGECKMNQIDGISIISHANLHTTLWWLINYGDYSDPILIRTFLYSSISFTTATELFDNLMQIYNLVVPVPKAISLRYSLCDTRKRVTYFLRIWLEYFFERDFYHDRCLFENLTAFFSELNENNQKQDANMLKLLIIRVNKKKLMDKGMNRFVQMNATLPTTPSSSKLSSKSAHSVLSIPSSLPSDQKFLDWNVTAVAEQFVLIEFALFKAVDLKEISNLAWKSEQPRKTALNVVNLFNRFDLVSQWVATEVVMAQFPKQRVIIIEKLIQLAQKCLELKNFNSLMEIIAGLNRGSVQRMKKAWEGVSHVAKDNFRALNSVVDSVQNYKNYREHLRKSVPPCLPYFGIFLRDLTFTDVGNKSKIGENINFEKIYMTSRILKDIQMYQKTAYTFDEDEYLQPLLRRLLAMPEEMLYKHSQSIEPSIPMAN